MTIEGLGAVAEGVISGGIKEAFTMKNIQGASAFLKTTNTNVNEGMSLPAAVAKGAVRGALYSTIPGAMHVASLSKFAVQGTVAAHKYRRSVAERFITEGYSSQRVGSGFQDTMQAQTMRQAALQQIQGNKLNARSALGGEARIFSNRRYTG